MLFMSNKKLLAEWLQSPAQGSYLTPFNKIIDHIITHERNQNKNSNMSSTCQKLLQLYFWRVCFNKIIIKIHQWSLQRLSIGRDDSSHFHSLRFYWYEDGMRSFNWNMPMQAISSSLTIFSTHKPKQCELSNPWN